MHRHFRKSDFQNDRKRNSIWNLALIFGFRFSLSGRKAGIVFAKASQDANFQCLFFALGQKNGRRRFRRSLSDGNKFSLRVLFYCDTINEFLKSFSPQDRVAPADGQFKTSSLLWYPVVNVFIKRTVNV